MWELIDKYIISPLKSWAIKRSLKPKLPVAMFFYEKTPPFPQGKVVYKIKRHIIKAPYNTKIDIPLVLQEWKYPSGFRLYIISAQNHSDIKEENIKIDVDFNGSLIQDINIKNPNRMHLIQGQVSGGRVLFKIDELFPSERQEVTIVVNGGNIHSFKSWSETVGQKDTFICELIPDLPNNPSQNKV